MFSADRWREILEVLAAKPSRTLLTAFGVGWGIYIFILLLAVNDGLEKGVRLDFGNIATNTVFIWGRSTTEAYDGLPKGRPIRYRVGDLEAIRDQVPHLKYISGRNQQRSSEPNVIRGVESGSYVIFADFPDIMNQEPMDITLGRFINAWDIEKRRKIAVIGPGVVRELYKSDEEVLGTYIKIQGVNFQVVGTYKKANESADDTEDQKSIYVPFTSFNQVFNQGDRVGWMAITAEDEFPITALKGQIIDVLKRNHRVSPTDNRAIGNNDIFEEFGKVQSLFDVLDLVAIVVGLMVLLSGIIGVSNIMLIIVKERTREIGIRRALGEKASSIRYQILAESAVITVLSGMMGVGFGALTIYGINYALEQVGPVDMFFNPSVQIGYVALALFFLVGSGLLAGFIPARSALRVRPIEAIRTE